MNYSLNLQPYYDRYFKRNNDLRKNTAISVKAASWLLEKADELCANRGPIRVADLGSGFSSIAFRYWKKEVSPQSIVYTTDHDWVWLGQTLVALEEERLPTDHCIHHSLWQTIDTGFYDLMFTDLGRGYRQEQFSVYSKRLKDDGLLILDDWQFEENPDKKGWRPFTPILEEEGFTVNSLPDNRDRFGRFMACATRK